MVHHEIDDFEPNIEQIVSDAFEEVWLDIKTIKVCIKYLQKVESRVLGERIQERAIPLAIMCLKEMYVCVISVLNMQMS